MKFKVNDIALMVYLDSTTAQIGEYSHVRVLKIEGEDILIQNSEGFQAWVTEHYLEEVEDI